MLALDIDPIHVILTHIIYGPDKNYTSKNSDNRRTIGAKNATQAANLSK